MRTAQSVVISVWWKIEFKDGESMIVTIPIALDLMKSVHTKQRLTLRRGDDAYKLKVTLLNGMQIISVSKYATVVFNCAKPDNTYVEISGKTENDGTVSFEINNNTLAAVGVCNCEIQIIDGGQLTSQRFEIFVEPTVISDDVIKSTSEYGVLKQIIDALKGANNTSDIPNAHLEGYGNRAICKLDSRIKYVSGKGFYSTVYDENLIGEHINVFLGDEFTENGYKGKYRATVTELSKTADENGYKIYDTGEITTAVGIMTAAGYIPKGFYGSLIINGGVDGDVDVEVPPEFSAHCGGVGSLCGLNGFTSGVGCESTGFCSRASGYFSTAKGERAVSDGYRCLADGNESLAVNLRTKAKGYSSFASGGDTEANADYTTAQGFHTVANSMYQSVRGLYNEIDSGGKYLDIVGCGTSEGRRKNAYALDKQGNGYFGGKVYSGGKECLTVDTINAYIGRFAMTTLVAGVSGSLKIELDYPIDYHGWRLFVDGKELTDKLIGTNETFVTAPVIMDGALTVVFYNGEDEILRAETEPCGKTNEIRYGKLKILG